MIGEGPTLNESLPPRLKEALDAELQPGERPVMTVRAHPGAGLAATPTRLLILREDDGIISQVTAQSYPLTDLTAVELRETGAGAQLVSPVAGEPEPMTLEVPPYDTAKFRMVAERLREMSVRPTVNTPAGVPSGGSLAAERCPKCATALPDAAAYCPSCGLQTRDSCWECGRSLETEWRFCPDCGGDTTEVGVVPCPSCRQPVGREFAYCVQCGAEVRRTCDECDRVLRRSWRHCPDCGAQAPGEASADPDARGAVARPAFRETMAPVPPGAAPAGSSVEAEALNQRGIEAYERERFDEAIGLFRRAVGITPENATFHCNLAVALWEKGLDEEAFAEYQQTLALDPTNARALVEMGSLYAQQERYEEARDCWERAIRVAPESNEATEARQSLENLENL